MRIKYLLSLAVMGSLSMLAGCDERPDEIASDISGLSVPSNAVVTSIRLESARFRTVGYRLVQLQLDSSAFETAGREAPALGYRRLPVPAGAYYTSLKPYLSETASGWYRVVVADSHDSATFKLAVLDARKRTLLAEENW